MLRALVLILLLANLVFFAWAQGWLRVLGTGPAVQSEPHRMTQQIRPDALRVVPESPATQAPVRAPAPVPEGAESGGASSAGT